MPVASLLGEPEHARERSDGLVLDLDAHAGRLARDIVRVVKQSHDMPEKRGQRDLREHMADIAGGEFRHFGLEAA